MFNVKEKFASLDRRRFPRNTFSNFVKNNRPDEVFSFTYRNDYCLSSIEIQ